MCSCVLNCMKFKFVNKASLRYERCQILQSWCSRACCAQFYSGNWSWEFGFYQCLANDWAGKVTSVCVGLLSLSAALFPVAVESAASADKLDDKILGLLI